MNKSHFSLRLISIQIARTGEPGTTGINDAKISSELREKFSTKNAWLLSESITAEQAAQSEAPPVFPNLGPSDLLLVPPIKILEKETGGSAKNHPRFKKNLIPFYLTISYPTHVWFWGCILLFRLICLNSSNSTKDGKLEALVKITVEPLSYWWKLTALWIRKVSGAWSADKGSSKLGREASPRPLFQGVFREQEQKKSCCCIWHIICYSSFSFIKLDFYSLRKATDSQLFPDVSFYCYEKF